MTICVVLTMHCLKNHVNVAASVSFDCYYCFDIGSAIALFVFEQRGAKHNQHF